MRYGKHFVHFELMLLCVHASHLFICFVHVLTRNGSPTVLCDLCTVTKNLTRFRWYLFSTVPHMGTDTREMLHSQFRVTCALSQKIWFVSEDILSLQHFSLRHFLPLVLCSLSRTRHGLTHHWKPFSQFCVTCILSQKKLLPCCRYTSLSMQSLFSNEIQLGSSQTQNCQWQNCNDRISTKVPMVKILQSYLDNLPLSKLFSPLSKIFAIFLFNWWNWKQHFANGENFFDNGENFWTMAKII